MTTLTPHRWYQGTDFWSWAEAQSVPVAPADAKPTMVWLDKETTGLDPINEVPLEVGVILTDDMGNLIPDGAATWFVSDFNDFYWSRRIEAMIPLVREMHEKSGLLADLAELAKYPYNSRTAAQVEFGVTSWLIRAFRGGPVEDKDKLPPFGSSIGFDRGFMQNWMPELNKWFHYRNGDLSALRIFAYKHLPHLKKLEPEKRELHRPLPDLIDSIKLYRFLINNIFIEPVGE